MNLTLLDPSATQAAPLARLCSALAPSALAPDQWARIQNLRSDKFGDLYARGGSSRLSLEPIASGGTITVGACLGLWSGELNGDTYVIAAHVVTDTSVSASPFVRIYSYNTTTWAATELTGVGTWSGASGLTRLENTTNLVTFRVVRVRRRYYFGVVKPARDLLVIQNGADLPRVYDPAYATNTSIGQPQAIGVHKAITVPTGAEQFRKVYRYAHYLQVANTTGAGRTYMASSGRMAWAETTTSPYNSGGNYCSKLSSGLAQTGDYADVRYSSAATFPGDQLAFIVEGTATQVYNILSANALAFSTSSALQNVPIVNGGANWTGINPIVVTTSSAHGLATGDQVVISGVTGNTNANGTFTITVLSSTTFSIPTLGNGVFGGSGVVNWNAVSRLWQTVYDPTDSEKKSYTLITFDASSNRHLVIFPGIAGIDPASRTFSHLRVTRVASTTSTTSDAFTLLMLAGPSASAFYYGTDFAVAYRDAQSGAESPSFISSSTQGELLYAMGGPDTGLSLPQPNTNTLLDWRLLIKHSDDLSQITGGLDGQPNVADIYASYLGADGHLGAYLWIQAVQMWDAGTSGPDKVWTALHSSTPFIASETEDWIFLSGRPARAQRDITFPAPSEFNEAMPAGSSMAFASGRSFVGAPVDGGFTQTGDVAFSAQFHPFRFQNVSEAQTDGGRAQLAGEIVQAIIGLAAGPQGAARLYVLGSRGCHALGNADAYASGLYTDADNLSRPQLVGPHGTMEPGSVAVYATQAFWVDQEGQVIRFDGGRFASISRQSVDDKFRAIPASRRGSARGAFVRDRYLLAYTPSAGTANTRLLGYASLFGYWEFDDLFPGVLDGAHLARFQDSAQTGPGQRLLVAADSGGALYAYDEGATEYDLANIAVRLTSRRIEFHRIFGRSAREIGAGGLVAWVGAVTDTQSGASLQVDRLYDPNGSQFRSSQALDNPVVAGGLRYGDDTGATVSEVTATGQPEGGSSVQLDFQTTLSSGARIRQLFVEVDAIESIDKVGAA